MAQPPADVQVLTDASLEIFEAVATLEYAGRRPSRSAITAAARRDQTVVDDALDGMTAHGLLTMTDEDGEPVYVPARRDWSTQPGQAAGHPMGEPAGARGRSAAPDHRAAAIVNREPAGSRTATRGAEVTEAKMISTPGPDGPPPSIQGWPDSGSVAVITWRAGSGEVYQQELGNEPEAIALIRKIAAADQLELVSAQLRRVGIGPDS